MSVTMENKVAHDKKFGHTDLYLDFIEDRSRLDKYIIVSGPAETAGKIEQTKIDRDRICDILINQNKDFKSKSATFENIDRLRQDDALCIFAGQQAGLFGGPLYTIYKMLVIKRLFNKIKHA